MANGNLAQRVKELRKRRGLSQEELAQESGLSLRTVQRVENGETEPTGETLKRISNAFDLSPEELIIWTNNEDEFKKTVAAKNEYLHIFDNKLIIRVSSESQFLSYWFYFDFLHRPKRILKHFERV